MKTRICFIAVLLISSSFTLALQGVPFSWGPGSGSHHGNIFSNYAPATTYVGIFPGYREGAYSRTYRSGFTGSAFYRMSTRDNYGSSYYGNDYYRGGYQRGNYYRGSHYYYPPRSFFMMSGAWDPGRFRQKSLYSSENFVEEWKDQDPVRETGSGLENSPLLSPGMSREAVLSVLGSPLQKVRFEAKEIWKYSSFSLIFEDGALTELR